jgi:hypothetical protein
MKRCHCLAAKRTFEDLWKESNSQSDDNPQFIEASLSEGFIVGTPLIYSSDH